MSDGVKNFTSMIGKTALKIIWVFPELDLFSEFKPVNTCMLTGFHMENNISPENVFEDPFLK